MNGQIINLEYCFGFVYSDMIKTSNFLTVINEI